MKRSWLLIPGLALGPRHFDGVRRRLGELDSRTVVLNQWETPLTATPELIWERYKLPTTTTDGHTVGLVGHSMGGLTALRLAQRYPEVVDRVLLLDPSPPRPLRKSKPAPSSGEEFSHPWLGGRWRSRATVAIQEYRDYHALSGLVHADLDALRVPHPIVQMTGMRSGARFLRGQREEAEELGARLIGLRRCGHLIARTRPLAVAEAMTWLDSA